MASRRMNWPSSSSPMSSCSTYKCRRWMGARWDGRRSGAAQQLGALEPGQLGEQRLEELSHHAEREVALELRPARSEHAHSALPGSGTSGRQQGRLADAGRPFDDEERPPAGAGPAERGVDPGELPGPLEQTLRGLRPDAARPRDGGHADRTQPWRAQHRSTHRRFPHDPSYNDGAFPRNPGEGSKRRS